LIVFVIKRIKRDFNSTSTTTENRKRFDFGQTLKNRFVIPAVAANAPMPNYS